MASFLLGWCQGATLLRSCILLESKFLKKKNAIIPLREEFMLILYPSCYPIKLSPLLGVLLISISIVIFFFPLSPSSLIKVSDLFRFFFK